MDKIAQAEIILKEFIIVMNDWEVTYYAKVKSQGIALLQNEMKEKVTEIFNKFCTIKDRKFGKPTNVSVRFPPTYSPDEEILKIEEIKKNKVAIYTQQHVGVKNKFRYTLHYKNDEWQIDKKEVYDQFETKWEKYSL